MLVMMRIQRAVFATAWVILGLLLPSLSWGVGLGQLSVQSRLGQPLHLQVQLLATSAADAGSLEVGLASREEFERAQVLYPDSADVLKFAVVPSADGKYHIAVTSDNPVSDTYLHLLLLVTWPSGKVVREYTALLDPPLYSGDTPATVQVPSTRPSPSNTQPAARLPDSTPSSTSSTPTPSAAASDPPSSTPGSTPGSADGYQGGYQSSVTVRYGDNLSVILRRLNRPSNVNLFQGLTALQNANPQAFINGNMNRLRTGAVLQIPSFEQMAAMSRQQSAASFSQQLAQYSQYLTRLGVQQQFEQTTSVPATAPTSPSTEQPQSTLADVPDTGAAEIPAAPTAVDEPSDLGAQPEEATATVTQPEEATATVTQPEEATATVTQPSDQLRISQQPTDKPATPATSGDVNDQQQMEAIRAQLQGLDETLITSGVESEAARQRLRKVLSQSQRSAGLIDIESGLTTGQQVAGDDNSAAPSESATQGESPQPSTPTTTDESQAAANNNAQNNGDASPAATEQATPEQPSAEAGGVMGILSGLVDSVSGLLASASGYTSKLLIAIVVLAAGWVFYRRRQAYDEFEDSLLDTDSEQASEFGDTPESGFASPQSVSQSSLVTKKSAKAKAKKEIDEVDMDISGSALDLTVAGSMSFLGQESASGVTEEENEVVRSGAIDPMDEADVFLAYGREEQGIKVLQDAYAAHPEREDIVGKLLEIYHKQDDRNSFDELATELNTRINDPNNDLWQKVIVMGREVSPDNSLYQTPGQASDELELATPRQSQSEPAAALPDDLDMPEDLLDLLDTPQSEAAPAAAAGASGDTEVDTSGDSELSELSDASEVAAATDDELATEQLSFVDEINAGASEIDEPSSILSEAIRASELEQEQDSISDAMLQTLTKEDAASGLDEMTWDLGEGDFDLEAAQRQSQHQQDDAAAAKAVDNEDTQSVDTLAAAMDSMTEEVIEPDSQMSEISVMGDSQAVEPSAEATLDLAKMCIDIGDKDTAKRFIEEVINKGDEQQRDEAKQLAKALVE